MYSICMINLLSLTAYELRQILTNLGENISDEEVAEMVKEADVDGDYKINFEGRKIALATPISIF